jgi:hypothetical protein
MILTGGFMDREKNAAAVALGALGGVAKWEKITDPNKRSRLMRAVRRGKKKAKPKRGK